MLGQGDPGPSDSCDGDSLLAQPALVPDPLGAIHRRTTDVLSGAGPADFPVGRTSPAHHPPVPPPDRLGAIGSCLLSQDFSGYVIGLLLSATRENINSAYQSAWNHWCNWCHAREVDPLSGVVREILEFLAFYFGSGASYNSVNIARSMLSSTLNLIGTGPVDAGRHPLVTQLLKAIHQTKPPEPR